MADPLLFIIVDGMSYRVTGYATLAKLKAAVTDAFATGGLLRLSVAAREGGKATRGTLFLVPGRVGSVAVSDIDLVPSQHGIGTGPRLGSQHGID